jgi:hypothetical protein
MPLPPVIIATLLASLLMAVLASSPKNYAAVLQRK